MQGEGIIDVEGHKRDRATRFSTSVFFYYQTIPTRPMIHALKYFRILLHIRRYVTEYVLNPRYAAEGKIFLYRFCV
jgi:hypothetical protein